ncbi:hypothetical protein KI387_007878, partial [Taxus chinensis]
KSPLWDPNRVLLRAMVDAQQQLIQTMEHMSSTLDRLALDRPRDRRGSSRARHDQRPRSSKFSIHKGQTPQDKEAEVIDIFEE